MTTACRALQCGLLARQLPLRQNALQLQPCLQPLLGQPCMDMGELVKLPLSQLQLQLQLQVCSCALQRGLQLWLACWHETWLLAGQGSAFHLLLRFSNGTPWYTASPSECRPKWT